MFASLYYVFFCSLYLFTTNSKCTESTEEALSVSQQASLCAECLCVQILTDFITPVICHKFLFFSLLSLYVHWAESYCFRIRTNVLLELLHRFMSCRIVPLTSYVVTLPLKFHVQTQISISTYCKCPHKGGKKPPAGCIPLPPWSLSNRTKHFQIVSPQRRSWCCTQLS